VSKHYVNQQFSSKIYLFSVLKWPLDRAKGRTTSYGKHPRASRSLYDKLFLKSSLCPYWNFSLSTRYKMNFKQVLSTREMSVHFGTRGTHLFKVPSWAKYLSNYFTPLTKVAQTKTYPTSHKLSLNQDKITYTCSEEEQLIELSSFNMCLTLQS
jgi:hypothetical protein